MGTTSQYIGCRRAVPVLVTLIAVVDIPYPNGLAACMARKGINDPQLADAAGTTKQQIHKLRHGERKLTVQWAKRLAPHLNASWQELVDSAPSPADVERAELWAAFEMMNAEERRALLTMAKAVVRWEEPPEPQPAPRPKERAPPPRPFTGGRVKENGSGACVGNVRPLRAGEAD